MALQGGTGVNGVAVVIPVYAARYLAEALASVFAQTRLPDEVIVVDDGSPDRQALEETLELYGDHVRALAQLNHGAGAARNLGIRSSHADLIAFLDADDCWEPHYLDTQLKRLAAHPECDVVYSDATYFGDTPLAGRRFMAFAPSHGEVTATSLLALRCHVPLSASVVRRAALIREGLFDTSLRRGQDFDLWLRMALRGVKFTHHRLPLMRHRIHADNLSGSHVSMMERAAAVFTKALSELPLTEGQRRIARAQIGRFEAEIAVEQAKALLTQGDVAGARAVFARACPTLRRWKVGAALLGLRVAPHLFRRVYLARRLQRS